MGGLCAALRLARGGCAVRVLEARSEPGGLASRVVAGGVTFDAGPYILLDRPGLEWAFRALGLDLQERVPLRRIEDVYEVRSPGAPPVRFLASLDETADGLEKTWKGSGRRYRAFVARTRRVYERLEPLLHVSRPSPLDVVRAGALVAVPFLLRPLRSVLDATGLPEPVKQAIGIWTHVAGQRLEEAPSPLAFVPSLIHIVGCYLAPAGIASIPAALARAAEAAGCEISYGTRARAIKTRAGRVETVETESGEVIAADAVVSDVGLATYLTLLDPPPAAAGKLRRLPLQSPGVSAYLAVRGPAAPPYLRFLLPGGDRLCRLLVQPAAVAPSAEAPADVWRPARLLAPMRHADAERGVDAQRAFLTELLDETWWRGELEYRVVATRIPAEWGREFHLYGNAMNPVMTAAFMRAGRLAHRSPYARGLYLAGSSTHPGQWVSFTAISGVLAAERALEDLCS
jgi:phytoene desaturase